MATPRIGGRKVDDGYGDTTHVRPDSIVGDIAPTDPRRVSLSLVLWGGVVRAFVCSELFWSLAEVYGWRPRRCRGSVF